jgi:Uma2 family endonuclease
MKTAEAKPGAPAVLSNGQARGGTSVFSNDIEIHVPGSVADIDSFRQWADSPEFPKEGNIWWLCGGVWADMSKQQAYSHLDVKGAIFAVLYFLVKQGRIGRVFSDGFHFTNYEADVSGVPDGLYFSRESLRSGRVRQIEGLENGVVEIQGTPDMVLEVVSDRSVKKDSVTLVQAYWKAGITEYWLVDARKGRLQFDILKTTPKGFKRTPKKHGWVPSAVFGRSFRLSVAKDEDDQPEYTLEVRR